MVTYNPYETRKIIKVVRDIVRPSMFLTTLLFPNLIPPTGDRKVAFDVENKNRGIALYCSPLANGRPVRERGYYTKEFEPAYLKPWMPFDPYRILSKIAGEAVGGDLTPEQRQSASLVKGFADLTDMTLRRFELSAAIALRTGKETFSGDGMPVPIEVDYQRNAGHTITLTGGNRWGQSGISPVDNMETWAQTFLATTGIAANRWIFDPKAWALFKADPKIKDLIDITYKRQSGPNQVDPLVLGDVKQGQLMGTFKSGSTIELWVYQQTYTDENQASQQIMTDNTVFLAYEGDPELMQTQAFGTVLDPMLGYRAELLRDSVTGGRMHMAPKHWFVQPPAVGEAIQLQSSPIMALTTPDTTMCATVA